MKGCEKMRLKRLLSLLISSAMTISVMPLTAFAAQEPPMPYGASEDMFNGYLQLNFSYTDTEWLDAVNVLSVNGNKYEEVNSSSSMDDTKFFSSSISYYIQIGNEHIDKDGGENNIVISANGYDNLELSAKKSGGSWKVEKSEEPADENKKTVTLKAEKVVEEYIGDYYTLTPEGDKDYIQNIEGVYVNESKWEEEERNSSYLVGEDYYIDREYNRIVFAADERSNRDILKDGDVIRITNPYYNDVELKVTIDEDGDFSVSDINEGGIYPLSLFRSIKMK